jgi:hypothetical protein
MITALIGMTTDPKSRNRITALAPSVSAMAYGIVSAWLSMKSWPLAARPPTCVVTPSTATARTPVTTAVPSGETGRAG